MNDSIVKGLLEETIFPDSSRDKTLQRRLGIFHLRTDFLRYNRLIQSAIMQRVLIVKCECDYAANAFVYTAMSEDFEVLPEGRIIPYYDIEVTIESIDDETSYNVRFVMSDRQKR